MIRIEDFSFTYQGCPTPALDRVDIQVEPGEFVAVVGANRSGKSSLCHALTGVIPHLYHGTMQGDVHVAGKNVMDTGVAAMSGVVSLVMQKPEQQLSGVRFTVREEVGFNLENRGIPREEIAQRVERAMRRTGVADLADTSPHHLSWGQLQRVVMTASLAADTPVLVLDEPTTFLDPGNTLQTFTLLRELCDSGTTVVLAEHRPEFIALFADRVIALHKGNVVLDGSPAEVLGASMLPEIGLGWTRYTQVAQLAAERGLWREDHPMPVTPEATVVGLRRQEDS